MSQQGSCTSVDEYLVRHPQLQLSEVEKEQLEKSVARLFLFGNELLDRMRASLPVSLKQCLVLQFTNYETPQAKAGGFAPELNVISISMGLIQRISSTSRGLALEEHSIQSIERAMLIIVLGHELTHVLFGHNEIIDDEPLEASAMEVHADYFCGLYLAHLLHTVKNDAERDKTIAVIAFLAAVLLFAELKSDRTHTYHSTPVRLLVVIGGYMRWTIENCQIAAKQLEHIMDLNNLHSLISDVIRDPSLYERVHSCISASTSADESLEETLAAAETFRKKWHSLSSLLAPIRDQLD